MAEVKKVMVAVDESEYSRYALGWALNNLHLWFPSHKDVSLLVYHVQPLLNLGGASPFGVTPPELIGSLVDQQRKVSEALLDRAKEMCAQKNVVAETVMELGDPKETICDAVEKMQVDLLIIGSHGYGMIKRAFLGSVSSYCVNHAKCPVLVVKKPQ